jgi:hypothetical protein
VQFGNIIPSGLIIKDDQNIVPLISFSPEEELSYTVAAINKDKTAVYFNPIVLYPAAVDKKVEKLIPAKFENTMEKAFLSTVELILDPNTL